MLKNLEIENFRCFENTSISGLTRVNLIGGQNNAGKTALLEALLLYELPRPQTIIELKQFRKESTDFAQAVPDRAWDNLFFNLDKEKVIKIKGEEDIFKKKELRLSVSNSIAHLEDRAVAQHSHQELTTAYDQFRLNDKDTEVLKKILINFG